jgi:AcrR family transcriptional regulator
VSRGNGKAFQLSEQALSRRELYREQTRDEIMTIGLRQIADGGVEALSLNAIAKEMAVSGAALYRYFASRDELIAALMVQAYKDLAHALEATAARRHKSGPARVHAVAAAYREWALAQPHRYRLIFSTRVGPGSLASDDIVLASQRSMNVFLQALSGLTSRSEASGRTVSPALASQLRAWHRRSTEPALPPATLRLGMTCWTRLHGILSLEIDGHLLATNVDPALLYHAEVDDLIG